MPGRKAWVAIELLRRLTLAGAEECNGNCGRRPFCGKALLGKKCSVKNFLQRLRHGGILLNLYKVIETAVTVLTGDKPQAKCQKFLVQVSPGSFDLLC